MVDVEEYSTWYLYSQLVSEAVVSKRAGGTGYVRVDCPVCLYKLGKADRKQCLSYNVTSRYWMCWRCSARGRLHTDDLDFVPEDLPKVEHVKLQLPAEHVLLGGEPACSSVVFSEALAYVTNTRGLSLDMVRDLRIGACIGGRFSGRVILPVYDTHDVLRWYVGRSWKAKSVLPYLYPVGAREGVVFNERALDVQTDVPALVVEGMFDAYALWPHGVAVLGKTTEKHLERLRHAQRPVVLVPDGDAWQEGLAQLQWLRMRGVCSGLLRLPPRKDPDELAHVVLEAAPLSVHAGRYVEVD